MTAKCLIRRYFYSGWVFLLPYTFVYTFFAWRRWPVDSVESSGSNVGGHHLSLVGAYWILHALNAASAVWLILARLRQKASVQIVGVDLESENTRRVKRRVKLVGGLLLLSLLISGLYLEFPSDPWQHYRRIFEWEHVSTVREHSEWYKSSYFLPFSLLRGVAINHQSSGLTIYYTVISGLLCWQYYRLAVACGLGVRGSLIFTVLQSVLFGNSSFSFYRYYGLSSTVVAQIAAVALTRLAIECAVAGMARTADGGGPLQRWWNRDVTVAVLSAPGLLFIIAMNHGQEFGIAGLGIAAVLVWRIMRAKVAVQIASLALFVILNVAVYLWFPRHPAINADFRITGVFTPWCGINLIDPIIFERFVQIFGIMGLANLLSGVFLCLKGHIVGLLTIVPVISLLFPMIAIPLADEVVGKAVWGNIIYYQRVLFAVPAGLSLVALLQMGARKFATVQGYQKSFGNPYIVTIVGTLLLVTISPSDPYYNRFWNAEAIAPSDLSMQSVASGSVAAEVEQLAPGRKIALVAAPGIGYVAEATGLEVVSYTAKWITDGTPTSSAIASIEGIRGGPLTALLVQSPTQYLYTPYSQAGRLSGHWPAQEVASEYAGGPELEAAAQNHSGAWHRLGQDDFFLFGKP